MSVPDMKEDVAAISKSTVRVIIPVYNAEKLSEKL